MARSAIYGAVINIILNIVLIIWIGVQGATIATAVSAFVIYYVRKRAVGAGIKIEKEYKIMLMWILLCIQSLHETLAGRNNYILYYNRVELFYNS